MSARVAILVPIHNAAPFIERTLESVREQTNSSWHAVLVDDASSDGSADIAAGYAEREPDRFTLIRLTDNAGVVRARNLAVESAPDSELAVLLDHDDWLREDYLEQMVGVYDAERAKGRRVGIVGCDALLYEGNGVAPDTWSERTGWRDRVGWYDQVTLDTLIRRNTIFARALFDRQAFIEVGGLAPECAGADDFDLWLRMVEAGYEVAVIREPLATYRLHEAALSRDRVRMCEGGIAAYERMLARGNLSARQRRAVRVRMRHLRAERALALLRIARERGERLEALRQGAVAAPLGTLALLQDRLSR